MMEKLSKPVDGLVSTDEITCKTMRYMEAGNNSRKVSKIFITQNGQRLAYSKQYLRAPYGELHGISGYVQEK